MYSKRYYFSFLADRHPRSTAVNDTYNVEIHQLDYEGTATEIDAARNPVLVDFVNSNLSKLEPIRFSNATLNLIATEGLELSDLYSEDDREWLVIIKRTPAGSTEYTIWKGFILPDECSEAFTYLPYSIEAKAVDGLSLLKNLSFVQETGDFFMGKISFKDVIWNCLNRLQIPGMDLYTSANIYPIDLTPADATDPLAETYVNASRYYKDEYETPMTCEEVLKSALELWTACIVQRDGAWFVYRPNELATAGDKVFRKYDSVTSDYIEAVTVDPDKLLGGEVEETPWFHTNVDQIKTISRPYKNATIKYTYGFRSSLLDNPQLVNDGTTLPGWTASAGIEDNILISPAGVEFISDGVDANTNYYTANGVTVTEGDVYSFKAITENFGYAVKGRVQVKLVTSPVTWYLNGAGVWVIAATTLNMHNGVSNKEERMDFPDAPTTTASGVDKTFLYNAEPVPADGEIFVSFFEADTSSNNAGYEDGSVIYKAISMDYAREENDPIVGEIHKAEQTGGFTYVPDIVEVFNGDNDAEIFVGGIYKNDEDTLTDLWKRAGVTESQSFLEIAVREMLRLNASPFIRLEGSVFPYFDPLSRFTINLLDGYFLPLQLKYNLQDNTVYAVLGMASAADLTMEYTVSPDYGNNITKVTIKEP